MLAQQIDLLPTVLYWTGGARLAGLLGSSLVPNADGTARHTRPPEALGYVQLDNRRIRSFISGNLKLIDYQEVAQWYGEPSVALYDLKQDSGERENLAHERPVRVGHMTARLREHLLQQTRSLTPSEAVISKEVEERLKALGYLK